MASNTNSGLRNQTIYSVYVRNHTEQGDFKGVVSDLDRIKNLGIDIIWLMPIHPIGQYNKKGKLGCPYSISNYREINPEYGTLKDFQQLIYEIHKRKMKLMIDVVYNHTSYKSYLQSRHPEFFYKNSENAYGNKYGNWSDVIDLDYGNRDLWDYQVETLEYWASMGVDGYRCDVASIVPIEFWKFARERVNRINKDFIWLAESVGSDMVFDARNAGFLAHSDGELYEAFDITYDYDTYRYYTNYLNGKSDLEKWLEAKRAQEWIYPVNYLKLRFLENHDQPRAHYVFSNIDKLKIWTAFMFFEKGVALLYAGQEVLNKHTPSLFDIDKVDWIKENVDFSNYVKKLIKFKKEDFFKEGNYMIMESKKKGIIEARYEYKDKVVVGIFNVEDKIGEYEIEMPDGIYKNIINHKEVKIQNGRTKLEKEAVIFIR